MTTQPYDIDPAKKLFWDTMMDRVKNSTSKRVAEDVAQIKMVLGKVEKNTEEINGSFADFWRGIGQVWNGRQGKKK